MSSSAKSRERKFRHRRGGGDDDDDDKSTTPTITNSSSTTRTKATPSTSNTNKPKKPILSFAEDDEIDDSPFSRPPIKTTSTSSSSRLSSKSTSSHKLISSKDRTPRPPSSSLPSNVQPQAGLYTKEALLELQKNTRSIAGSSRLKPKEVETVVVLKGLVKPVSVLSSNEVETNGESRDSEELEKDDGLVMDQMAIDAIRAKRERLRKAKPAAQDFISLDGGSNHGEAEGLSDEEPEFRERIGLFGEKVGGADKKGVFEAFEEMVMSKEVKVDSLDEDEDDEEKMWEEEQARKGLGKRLDDGVGSHGGSVGVSGGGGSGRVSGPSNFGVTGLYGPSQDVVAGGNSGIGGLFGEEDVMPIAQHAELAEKALHENLRRAKETYDRTLSALTRTEENLSSSLLNITSLETSFAVADNKFVFMQKLGDFVAVICEFLKHKAPFIEELEEQIQNLHEERARAIAERRAADNSDELSEIEPAIIAARVEFQKRGSSAASVAAATAAAQAASTNASMSKSTQVELDEFGRDINLQKRMDATRRAEARRRRRDKADNKRKLAMGNDNSFQQMEGELSTDESDSEHTAYESTRDELLQVADKVLSDATEEFSQFHVVIERFDRFKKDYASSYRDAYMSLSIPTIFSPYVRLELLKWDPLHQDADFIDMKWHSLLFDYGIREDESTMNGDGVDADANLIPDLVEKLAIPILRHHLATCWDMLSTRETEFAVAAVKLIVRYVDLSSSELGTNLISVLHDRLSNAVADLVVPTWSPLEMNAVPNAGRVAAYRFGTSVRLLRNICLWNEILAMPVLEKISLDNLLFGKVLPHLHSIHSNVHDAISRSERVVASLNGVWTGPSATGDRSHNRKLQPLVDYLLLIGKTLKKRYASGAMDTENSKLVRRLKKMMVELNEYDHARALSKTFNLKEAL